MSQDFKRGIVQNIDKGPTKQGQYGPYCTCKITIEGKKYNLPFQDPTLPPCFNVGDTVQFMYEAKSFKNGEGKDISFNEIDKKTFGIADAQPQPTHQDPGPPEEYYQQPVHEYEDQYQQPARQAPARPAPCAPAALSDNDTRQILIVAQSSLERAMEFLTHNNPETKITEEAVTAQMKRFADEIFAYRP